MFSYIPWIHQKISTAVFTSASLCPAPSTRRCLQPLTLGHPLNPSQASVAQPRTCWMKVRTFSRPPGVKTCLGCAKRTVTAHGDWTRAFCGDGTESNVYWLQASSCWSMFAVASGDCTLQLQFVVIV